MLVPLITNPPLPNLLINETVVLTSENYAMSFPLQLLENDRINVKVSGNGQPVDLRITMANSTKTLVDQWDEAFYNFQLTIPFDETYVLVVSTYVGNVRATVIVTRS